MSCQSPFTVATLANLDQPLSQTLNLCVNCRVKQALAHRTILFLMSAMTLLPGWRVRWRCDNAHAAPLHANVGCQTHVSNVPVVILQEGLEAPPQEEGLLGSLVDDMERDVIVLPDEEDLSLTAMFRTQLRASEGTITDDDIARALPRDILEDGNMLPLSMQPVPHGLTPIAPPLGLASSPLASSSAALGSFNTTLNTSPLLRGMDKPQLEPQSAHAGAPLTVAQLEAQMMLVSDQAAQPPALPLQNTSQHALWGLPGMPPPVPAPPAGMHPPLVQPHPMMYAPPSHLNQMYPPHHMLPADMSPHMRPPMHTVPPRPGMPGFPGHMHMMRPGGGSTPHFPHGVPPGPHMMGPGAREVGCRFHRVSLPHVFFFSIPLQTHTHISACSIMQCNVVLPEQSCHFVWDDVCVVAPTHAVPFTVCAQVPWACMGAALCPRGCVARPQACAHPWARHLRVVVVVQGWGSWRVATTEQGAAAPIQA